MSKTFVDELTSSPEGMRLFQQERLILDVTELICELMDDQGVSRAELAKKMGCSRSSITQILSGQRNLTLRKASDLVCSLDRALNVHAGPLSVKESHWPVVTVDWRMKEPNNQWKLGDDGAADITCAGGLAIAS